MQCRPFSLSQVDGTSQFILVDEGISGTIGFGGLTYVGDHLTPMRLEARNNKNGNPQGTWVVYCSLLTFYKLHIKFTS